MDSKFKREVMLEHYQKPINKGLIDDSTYKKINTRNASCVDNVDIMLKIENDKIVILDADLAKPDGIYPLFQEFPDRCFQVGIAEANMASICAGLSAYGYIPVMVTFAPFATRRAFDQIAVSIASRRFLTR